MSNIYNFFVDIEMNSRLLRLLRLNTKRHDYGSKCYLARRLFENMHYLAKTDQVFLKFMDRMAMIVLRRVIFNPLAKALEAASAGRENYSLGHCLEAVPLFHRAIALGDLHSRADLAWMLIVGCKGVPIDIGASLRLLQPGYALGCPHCIGVLAMHKWVDYKIQVSDALNSKGKLPEPSFMEPDLLQDGVTKESKYAHYMMAMYYRDGWKGIPKDSGESIRFFKMSAAQGLDAAQYEVALLCYQQQGVLQDYDSALLYLHLAAQQGYVKAFVELWRFYKNGRGVQKNPNLALYWKSRADDAGAKC